MFLIRSLILSREVLLISGDYRKRSHTSRLVQRFVHARILARCLQKNLSANCSADRFRRFLLSIFLFLIKCKYCNLVWSQRICHMVWLSVTFSLDRFEYRIVHMMLSAVSRVSTAQD